MTNKNIVEVTYHRTGKSTNTNELGMREMQARVYQHRKSQYILVKAPPASGKSRALMFIALDKLANQGIKKVIVAVPERSIGKSFKNTDLVKYGFYDDWRVDVDLTKPGTETGKIKRVLDFLKSPKGRILVCTHATLRFTYEQVPDDHLFDNVMLGIDEFHHVSSEDSSVLGTALKNIMHNSSAHVLAMTGSYFRGDAVPILSPEDEQMFDKISYTYYEQLDGYRYLKSFGIDYKFYQGKYTDALNGAIDTTKKTIIHIPSVNSAESTKDKYDEVDHIFDAIGDPDTLQQDDKTGIYTIKSKQTGKILKVADLVTEDGRDKVQEYLRDDVKSADDLDIIIALNLAKEGFDWPWAEHALTIGYRHSLTEIVQIIGRVTRDSPNKTHAQFTNMIEQPDAKQGDVEYAVNQILKAITASLLMEQVLAPEIHLKRRKHDNEKPTGNADILIKGLKEPSTKRVKSIIENDMPDLKAAILDDDAVKSGIAANVDAEVMNKELIPKVVMTRYPDLTNEEIDEVSQYAVADSVLRHAEVETAKDQQGNTNEFLKMADKFINVDDLDINLIEKINPFQRAYDVISQNIDSNTLRIIERTIDAKKYDFSDDELVQLFKNAKVFVEKNGRRPDKNSNNEEEVRMAYALAKLSDMQARRARENEQQ